MPRAAKKRKAPIASKRELVQEARWFRRAAQTTIAKHRVSIRALEKLIRTLRRVLAAADKVLRAKRPTAKSLARVEKLLGDTPVRVPVARLAAKAEPRKARARELGPAEQLTDDALAVAVLHVARGSSVAKFHGDRAFISSVYDEGPISPAANGALLPWGLALEGFKLRLVMLQRKSLIRLTRADMVGAMKPELVARSETMRQGAQFHFVALD